MKIRIEKGRAAGVVAAPPSKSMAHRMLICAGLADGVSVIGNIAHSSDIDATVGCLNALGIKTVFNGNQVTVYGTGGRLSSVGTELDCRESGSTLRFLIPVCLTDGIGRRLHCSSRLAERPLGVYEDICDRYGYEFKRGDGFIGLCGKLSGGSYVVDGGISSQFISGLLFALPLTGDESIIEIKPPVESRPYIDMTRESLSRFKIQTFCRKSGEEIFIPGNQKYSVYNGSVEGDWSNAAFFEALNITGGNVTVTGLDKNSLQGDKVYKEYYDSLMKHDTEPIDISDCPDLAPILFSVAAICGGGTFTGTARLKYKESDRGQAMAEELSKCGIVCEISDNVIKVSGKLRQPDNILNGHNDHRIVMALSVLLTCTGGVIDGAEAVAKSFPDFFEKIGKAGIEVKKYDS